MYSHKMLNVFSGERPGHRERRTRAHRCAHLHALSGNLRMRPGPLYACACSGFRIQTKLTEVEVMCSRNGSDYRVPYPIHEPCVTVCRRNHDKAREDTICLPRPNAPTCLPDASGQIWTCRRGYSRCGGRQRAIARALPACCYLQYIFKNERSIWSVDPKKVNGPILSLSLNHM